jgi:hypothetical protein
MNATALLAGLGGTVLVLVILWDAFETILVPRRIGRRIRLTRYFYMVAWRIWRGRALAIRNASRREALLGFFGPLSLLMLLALWAAGLVIAFALLQVSAHAAAGVAHEPFATMLYLSGETFFTLGFGDITPATTAGRWLSVLEAGMGFGFLGTVVGYLPTMYASFSQREIEISLLDARAGSPPTAAEFLARLPRERTAARCDAMLRDWERWAAQVLETQISYPQLSYYRSQHVNQSWLSTLTMILDATALILAGIDELPTDQARLTFAMARHALVDVTQIFVPRRRGANARRLTPEALAALRARLANTPLRLPESPAFEERLAKLRLLYEPYAAELAASLLFELPPWVHASERRDNWKGGPWDRELGATCDDALLREAPAEEHF